MNDKVFMKEKKSNNIVVSIIIVALITSISSSAFTYVIMDSKSNENLNSSGNLQSSTNVKYDIQQVDNPVVAIAEKCSPSIVGVTVKYVTQTIYGTLDDAGSEGSGIIYTTDGYIITNYHVISSALNNSTATINVTLPNQKETILATIVGSDKVSDLALLKIDKTGLQAVELGKSVDTKVGELAVAIGNPLGQEFAGSVTVGYISAVNRKVTTDGRTYNLIQTDAAINSGNSGGALVNSKGQVIGINSIKVQETGVEGLGFALPIDDVKPIIEELLINKKISRPYIGLAGFNLDTKTAEKNSLVAGVYVQKVSANTPAQKAGIKNGDIITSIDGKSIETMEALNEIKNTKKVGDKIILKIYRQKQYVDIEVTLEEDTSVE
ncbi:MAG: trypsin-like peptidase domain-containing protein [Clostridia bacterium]|nr:trypsin-like peptidase domain-containing protein [Clostridia bacterium]MDD4386429.1 trypsin-like peptidase domain-containing protein [Clostridia bacterium]